MEILIREYFYGSEFLDAQISKTLQTVVNKVALTNVLLLNWYS